MRRPTAVETRVSSGPPLRSIEKTGRYFAPCTLSLDITDNRLPCRGLSYRSQTNPLPNLHSQSTHFCRPRYFAGLDVHWDTIAACVHDSETRRPCYETEFRAHMPNKLSRFVRDVYRKYRAFRACYETSSGGYVLHKDLKEPGVDCAVIAPGSIPKRGGIESIPTNGLHGLPHEADHFAGNCDCSNFRWSAFGYG